MAKELSLDEINALVDSRIKECYDQIQVEVERISNRKPQQLKIGIIEKPKIPLKMAPKEVPEISPKFISRINFSENPPTIESSPALTTRKSLKQWNPGQKKPKNNPITLNEFKKIVIKYGFRYYQNKLKPNLIIIRDSKHVARNLMSGEIEPLYAGFLNTNNDVAKVGTKYAYDISNSSSYEVLAPSEFMTTINLTEFENLISNLAEERDKVYENGNSNSKRKCQDW